ncbi:hypothetical protein BJF78_14380 [Pseudonocardia sp. CNS-139]|nr:hypothetical protein BJF78_14380 [Pseudonocardia sp. CNS-139]
MSTTPGDTMLQVTPCGPPSVATVLPSPITPAFDAAYPACPASGRTAASEVKSTIRPQRRSHMPGNTRRTRWNVPVRLIPISRCHRSVG